MQHAECYFFVIQMKFFWRNCVGMVQVHVNDDWHAVALRCANEVSEGHE